ncbi:MAG: hypothetical protein HC803_05660 [Saprospiraceae bacterium]|nr:hypothetical protein [Saprospiraceae bacterium]
MCTPKLEMMFLTKETLKQESSEFENPDKTNSILCNEALHYAPDTMHLDHTPMKYIRVNFHFMNSTDSANNLYGQKALDYAQSLLFYANHSLNENYKMFLPPNNNTPVLPTQYRYVLYSQPNIEGDNGVYSHFDDDLYFFVRVGKHRNLADKRVINLYNVGEDTILNLFIMPHHPDSAASPTYRAEGTGIALGNSVKIAGLTDSKEPIWNFKGLVNHEIGHVLGLSHTWQYNDGCDDTPNHPNCWNITTNAPCNTQTSNNVMDYNSRQHAWSPCQIGRVHRHLSDENNRARRTLIPNWCTLHDDRHIIIKDTIHWKGEKDLEGHLTIEDGGVLKISCRVSIPEHGKITVKPGGTLILNQCHLHNSCGKTWTGIEIQTLKKKSGQVTSRGNIRLENMENKIVLE